MPSEAKVKSTSLYNADYQLWLNLIVAQLKVQDFDALDWEDLIEEIESFGRSERYAIASYLMRLCEHLLKIKYWEAEREMCLRGWKREVINFRLQIQEELESSRSLRTFLQDILLNNTKTAENFFSVLAS